MKTHVLLESAFLLLVLSTGGALAGDHWDVSMIGSHGDTIWVKAEPIYEYLPCGGPWGTCGSTYGVTLVVNPCPLAVTCPGSTYVQGYYGNYFPYVVLALQSGVDYTFNGEAYTMNYDYMPLPDPPYMTCVPGCSEGIVFDSMVFSAPLGTEQQTWGGIKALFK